MTPNTHQRGVAILGASGGLGTALARRLSATGTPLVLGARDPARCESFDRATALPVDASDFDQVSRFLTSAAETLDLGGVVNCAGSLLLKPAHLTSRREYDETIAANLTSAFATVRAAAPLLRRDGGSIVLVASAAAEIGLTNHEAIAAAKAGVAGLTRAAAATYAGQGVRINAIAPGMVESAMTEKLLASDASREASIALHPLGEVGNHTATSDLVAWLLGDQAAWVTGQVWGVDGGLARVKTRPRTRLAPATRAKGEGSVGSTGSSS